MNQTISRQLFERAQLSIPGGVNSPVRAYRGVGGIPPFIVRGEGSHIFDADGNEYIDYIGSWGPLILGHRHPEILARPGAGAARAEPASARPPSRRSNSPKPIREMVPSIEMVRLVNSGTEATMSAPAPRPRLHRPRPHRQVRRLLSRPRRFAARQSRIRRRHPRTARFPGVPKGFSDTTIAVPFNNVDAVTRAFDRIRPDRRRHRGAGLRQYGLHPAEGGYLESLREITGQNQSLLIFDEVMTGFRVAPGGAQELYDIHPDLTTLGKVIGGGLPIAAYGGRADIMSQIAPSGPIYQAGTLSGNPLAVSAGLAVLHHLKAHPETYARLNGLGSALAACAPSSVTVSRVGSMMTWFFTDQNVIDYDSAKLCDISKFRRFFHAMLERGIYLPPSQFEALFLSAAHTEADIARTIEAARESFAIAL